MDLTADVLENCSIFHQLYKNENIQTMIDEVLILKNLRPTITLYMTGGGAYKYKTDIEVRWLSPRKRPACRPPSWERWRRSTRESTSAKR